MEKMTYVKALDVAIDTVEDGEVREKLISLRLQQMKKNSSSKKPTKRQVENVDVLQPAVLKFLATVDKATATTVANGVTVDFEVTTSRATSALKALREKGKVANFVEKRVSYYTLA